MYLLRLLTLLPVIVACTQQTTPSPGSHRAQFSAYPQNLLSSFATDCSGPGDTYVQTGRASFECRELLPPQASAVLILNYDGSPQDLPEIVTRLKAAKNAAGYLVDANVFFRVTQKDGTALVVPIEGKDLNRDLSALYTRYGGVPVP